LSLLRSKNCELYSVVEPGSSSSEVKDSANKEISQMSHSDSIVICSGTNDYELNGFSLTLQNDTHLIMSNEQANSILMSVPFRSMLDGSLCHHSMACPQVADGGPASRIGG
jgi:hypothetical protein